MLCARPLKWFYLTITVLSATGSAQCTAQCDCSQIDQRLDTLEKQVAELYALIQPGGSSTSAAPTYTPQPTQSATITTSRYPSTLVTTTANGFPTKSSQSIIVSTTTTTTTQAAQPTAAAPSDGYRAIGYFGNWDIYARKFFPYNIPADKLTHVLYSFADNRDDGTVFFTDTWADTDIHYANDSWNDVGTNVYGAVKQLALLKAKNRNLKVMLSVGGWTYTNTNKHMDVPASTAAGRQKFADTCVDMIRNYGFDGIDIDWEYPQNPTQGGQLLELLKTIRTAMDAYGNTLAYKDTNGNTVTPHFELSIAAPAGATNYQNMPLGEISKVTDFINLMAYDYAGSWDAVTGHAQNLYKSNSNPGATPFNTYDVVQAYFNAGVTPSKLNLGMPIYGRSFTNTKGLGQPFNGIGPGSWEAGVYDFKALPLPGAQVYYDQEAGATYSYDNSTGMLISYDTVDMALKKTDWLKQTGLGGAMWWEVSGDRYDGTGLIENVVASLRGSAGNGIQQTSNWLRYPDSKFDNIKAMGS